MTPAGEVAQGSGTSKCSLLSSKACFAPCSARAAHPDFATADLTSPRPASLAAVLPPAQRPRPGARANLWLVVSDPEHVPMSATGKVDKSALQQLLRARGVRCRPAARG